MSTMALSPKCEKFLFQWAMDGYYIYIRPDSSVWAEPNEEEGIWYVVTVQIRALPPHEFREEGRSVDACIKKLSKRIPRRKDLPKLPKPTKNDYIGFLAPHARWKEKYKSIVTEESSYARAVRGEGQAKMNALTTSHVGPIHDRHGDNKPQNSTEKGWGEDRVMEAIRQMFQTQSKGKKS